MGNLHREKCPCEAFLELGSPLLWVSTCQGFQACTPWVVPRILIKAKLLEKCFRGTT